ncbi:MBL fold metallo-hydrolase [Candidatus Woesearchaeota archaeon]|nr:MBL fold metallo-hydrolase [Candidatus Woesearchaeota archaeon]
MLGRQLRSSGGIVLQVGENQFHIDPGPGALAKAHEYGVNLRANTAILVSHSHMNHSNDLNAVIDAMTYRGFDKKGVLLASDTVINGSSSQQPVLQEFYKKCLERFIVLRPHQRIGINDVEIQMLPCDHSDPSTVGFKFYTTEFTLSYSSDAMYSRRLIEFYRNSNVLILNVVSVKGDGKNLSVNDALKIISEVKPRLCIITHFGISMMEYDPIIAARELQNETGVQVIAAKDGMVVNPVNYSVSQGQMTLNVFSPPKNAEVTELTPAKDVDIVQAIEENKTLNEIFGSEK